MSQPDSEYPKDARRTITDLQQEATSPREEGPYGVSEPDKAAPSNQKAEANPEAADQPKADKKPRPKSQSKDEAKPEKHAPDTESDDAERFEPPY